MPKTASDYVIGRVNAAAFEAYWRWTYATQSVPEGFASFETGIEAGPHRVFIMPNGQRIQMQMRPVPGPLHRSRQPDSAQMSLLSVSYECHTNGAYLLVQTQLALSVRPVLPWWSMTLLQRLQTEIRRRAGFMPTTRRVAFEEAANDLNKGIGAQVMTPRMMRAVLMFLVLVRDPEIVPPWLLVDDGTGTPIIENEPLLNISVPDDSIMPIFGEILVPPSRTQARYCTPLEAVVTAEELRG